MRRIICNFVAASVLLAGTGTGLPAQKPHAVKPGVPRSQRHEYRHEIDQMEEAWRTAMLQGNSSAMDVLLSDDYTAITANGAIQTKDQALSNMKTGSFKVTSLEVSDRKVRLYGSTAVVTSVAELKGSREAEEISGRYRYTRVYARNMQGQWKIVSFEASKVQEPDHR